MLTHNPLTRWEARRTQNTHLNTAEKVNSSCEHVFHPRPETHRWDSNQQISLSTSASLPKVRIHCWSSSHALNALCPPWKTSIQTSRRCDYTSESLCSPLLRGSQWIWPIGLALWVRGGTEEQQEIQRPHITGRQIHWATRMFNPINFHREGRLITLGSP